MANEMSNEAARVFAETAFYTGVGIQREMGQRNYVLTDEARDYWLERHQVTIPRALRAAGTDWATDRPVVIERAINLGTLAAQFAIADHHGAGPIAITRNHVVQASQKVSVPNVCGYCME